MGSSLCTMSVPSWCCLVACRLRRWATFAAPTQFVVVELVFNRKRCSALCGTFAMMWLMLTTKDDMAGSTQIGAVIVMGSATLQPPEVVASGGIEHQCPISTDRPQCVLATTRRWRRRFLVHNTSLVQRCTILGTRYTTPTTNRPI